jgi:aminoglycoside phosphotransferase (APT) family kinase protein
LIGKLGKSERAGTLHNTLKLLRAAGFRPPGKFIVPEPVAHISERGFVLQEKVAGIQVSDLMLETSESSRAAATESAKWLASLHTCGVRAPAGLSDRETVSEWTRDLARVAPESTARLHDITGGILQQLSIPAAESVPCHGDFHPMNIFIDEGKRVAVIDIDKFAEREPESDVGYFLMQAAAFDFFKNNSFDFTADARRAFVDTYEAERGRPIRRGRVAMFMAIAFLKNLHFELVLLKTGKVRYLEPWLEGATMAIADENIELSE